MPYGDSYNTYYVVGVLPCRHCDGRGVGPFGNTFDPDVGTVVCFTTDCPECKGTGHVETRVELSDALQDLLQPGSDTLEFLARMLAEQGKG